MLRLIKTNYNLMKVRLFSTSHVVVVPNTFTRFAQFVSTNKTLFDAVDQQNKENPLLQVVALELKDQFGQFKWPSFVEVGKQKKELLPHIYFHRFDKYDQLRHEQTIDRLKKSFTGWLGSPGVGKSTETNYILYQMVSHLGSPGFPSVVYYRLPNQVVIFSKQINDQEIQVSSHGKTPLGDLHGFIVENDLRFHGTEETKGKSCLILELGEDETGPRVNVPTLVTANSTSAEVTLKTLIKGGLRAYLVGPPSHEQILFMEWTRYLNGVNLWYLHDKRYVADEVTKQQLLLLPPSNNNENKKLFDEVITKMLSEVGPIPRAFSDFVKYQAYLSELSDPFTLVEAIDSTRNMEDFNIPSAVKYFLAQYPKTKTENDLSHGHLDAPVCASGLFNWLFVSSKAENLFINSKLSIEQYGNFGRTGVKYRIAESRVKQYLRKEYKDTWEWLQDVGYDSSLNTSHLINAIDIPEVKSYTLLEDAFINQPVDTLAVNCLYHSRAHDILAGGFVMVDHEKKVCYYFQVIEGNFKDHPVKLSLLEKVMNPLKIVEKNYKLHLIFVIDKVNHRPSGSKFIIPENKEENEIETATTLLKLKSGDNCSEKWKVLANHIETTVVRASLSYDFDAGLPFQQKAKNKSELMVAAILEELRTNGNKDQLVKLVGDYLKSQ